MSESIENQICKKILEIMKTYHEQDAAGYVDTPGGLEHMGDVWKLFGKWERVLNLSNSTPLEGMMKYSRYIKPEWKVQLDDLLKKLQQ